MCFQISSLHTCAVTDSCLSSAICTQMTVVPQVQLSSLPVQRVLTLYLPLLLHEKAEHLLSCTVP